jgi:choline dehydrogenase-like flavoprotein
VKRALVIGSGAGGATVAKELQGHFDVTILEAGGDFKPFLWTQARLEQLKRSGLLFDERLTRWFFPTMDIRRTREGMALVRGLGVGGTTTIATGNALRMDHDLKEIGLNLDAEFAELEREIPITNQHQSRWGEVTRALYDACHDLGLKPQPTPKMGNHSKCGPCGRCVLGCVARVKWDSRMFVQEALQKGAELLTGFRVDRIVIRNGRAVGVEGRQGWTRRYIPADLIVLAAGGLATPVILENSSIRCEQNLFVDPVLCVAATIKGVRQHRELEMPFVMQRPGYIVSPYFDYLSFMFNRAWRPPAKDTVSVMVKLADSNNGSVTPRGVSKPLTPRDRRLLAEGIEIGKEILAQVGADRERVFLGTLNAGHPGGSLPLTANEAATLHHERLPANLYVADATLLPESLGNPPILTIAALGKRVAKVATHQFA